MKVILEKDGYTIGCDELQYILRIGESHDSEYYPNITSLLDALGEKRIRRVVKPNSGLEGLHAAVEDTYHYITRLSKVLEPKKLNR